MSASLLIYGANRLTCTCANSRLLTVLGLLCSLSYIGASLCALLLNSLHVVLSLDIVFVCVHILGVC